MDIYKFRIINNFKMRDYLGLAKLLMELKMPSPPSQYLLCLNSISCYSNTKVISIAVSTYNRTTIYCAMQMMFSHYHNINMIALIQCTGNCYKKPVKQGEYVILKIRWIWTELNLKFEVVVPARALTSNVIQWALWNSNIRLHLGYSLKMRI